MTTTYTLANDDETSSTAAPYLVEMGGAARIPSVVLLTATGELIAGEAAAQAGLSGATGMPESMAASLHLGSDHIDIGGIVAVHDLGECGVISTNFCSTSPTGEITADTLVRLYTQS